MSVTGRITVWLLPSMLIWSGCAAPAVVNSAATIDSVAAEDAADVERLREGMLPLVQAEAASIPAMVPPPEVPLVIGDEAPEFHVPVKPSPAREQIELTVQGGLVTLVVRDAQLPDVLAALADSQHVNIVCATRASSAITIALRNVPFADAMTAIVSSCGCTWTTVGNIIHVTDMSAKTALSPEVQGKRIQVFPLDFVSGEDLSQAITNMVSPIGHSYVSAALETDNRRTQESIVVEDQPSVLDRIAQYIHQVDQPPRQVLIEVHVLQIQLENGCRHGVDFTHMMQFSGNTMKLQMAGFANPKAPQAFFAELSASNLLGLLEAVKDSTDAKTLASPKVMALNNQKSRIQIGEKLGYRVLSNTQTSTLESVEFLDVGVVLDVTPSISRDNQILMSINPKVSSGQVVEETGLPNEKTSEVETNVLLQDGQGVVIGGLIQEEDIDTQSRLMFLGDIYLVGSLFQRRVTSKVRKEVVFFLIPRIVPAGVTCDPCEAIDHQRVQTPLFHGPLHPNYRPYDARFPNCLDRPENPWMRKVHDGLFPVEGDCGYQCPSNTLEVIQPDGSGGPREVGPHLAPELDGQNLPIPNTILHDAHNVWPPIISRAAPQGPDLAKLPTIAVETPKKG